jgi:aldose 1-epimerase
MIAAKHALRLLACAALMGGAGCGSNPPQSETTDSSTPSTETAPSEPRDDSPSAGGNQQDTTMNLQSEPYGEMPDGREITQFHLTNGRGMSVSVINYGAIVTAVNVPDKTGQAANVTLTHPNLEGWLDNAPYFGGVVGRYANRIANGTFAIDGEEYSLAINNPPNSLHGGLKGFDKVVWDAEPIPATEHETGVVLRYRSPDGEEGYPGTLDAEVKYVLTADNELRIEYHATADRKTVVNLTNHCYWNLGGAGSGTILDHQLTLFCDKYLPVDETLIPTGELADVAGTPMDFTQAHTIGERIEQVAGGYDHCYVIDGSPGTVRPVARVRDPASGRVMEISSDQPGVQLYSGNFLNGEANNGGFTIHEGFCLETQLFPDSPNQPDFPTSLLEPGNVYKHVTVHKFSVEE